MTDNNKSIITNNNNNNKKNNKNNLLKFNKLIKREKKPLIKLAPKNPTFDLIIIK